jgi:spore maturation protein CgeB
VKALCVLGQHNYGDPARGLGYEYVNFLPALTQLGYAVTQFESFDRAPYRDFADMNRKLLETIDRVQPDLVFCVLMGYEIWTETLDRIRRVSGALLLNWGTDDSWKYEQYARFVAPHLDCYATTYPEALAKACNDGLNNFALTQWAASDVALAQPLPAAHCRYRVSFIGSAYGNRRSRIEDLRRRGIEVDCFGYGWANGPVPSTEIPRIMRESVVSLNFGDSGTQLRGLRPYRSRQIKARVFEVPGAGGFLLTEGAEHLTDYYRAGEEIETFDSRDELAEKLRYYLDRPDARDRIARAGHERTRREHTYSRRFVALLDAATAMRSAAGPASVPPPRVDESFESICARHRVTPLLRFVRALISAPARLLFGARRGPRAARRLLFELSWRLGGARTYSAAGWPGRVFYRES